MGVKQTLEFAFCLRTLWRPDTKSVKKKTKTKATHVISGEIYNVIFANGF